MWIFITDHGCGSFGCSSVSTNLAQILASFSGSDRKAKLNSSNNLCSVETARGPESVG